MDAQLPQAEGGAVEQSAGYAEAGWNRKRWRLGSACSGELYVTAGSSFRATQW